MGGKPGASITSKHKAKTNKIEKNENKRLHVSITVYEMMRYTVTHDNELGPWKLFGVLLLFVVCCLLLFTYK